MQQSKNVAMAFLLGTFLTGGVLGFSANSYMSRGEICVRKGVDPMVSVLADRLGLSESQSARVDSILDNRAVQYRRAMAPLRPQLDSIKLNSRQQIRQVLDERQQQGFEALIQELNDSTRKDDEHS